MSRAIGTIGLKGALAAIQNVGFGGSLKSLLKHPAGVPTSVMGLQFLYGLAKPVAKAMFTDAAGEAVGKTAKQEREETLQQRLQQVEARRWEMAMVRNSARLAAADPQRYNEVMAGRRLPRGAVVFGGQPRLDLMEELAMKMTGGHFQEPMDPDAEMQFLTKRSSRSGPKGPTDSVTFTRSPNPRAAGGGSETDDLLNSLSAQPNFGE